LENFYNILFEVSNEDRHEILLRLEGEPCNVTQISKKLGLSLPETSRHVARLSEVGLTWKDSEGLHRLTLYGRLVLKQLRELEFTTKYREYFTNHTTMELPLELMKRIGDLADSTYMHNAITFLHSVENITRDAEEFVWFQGDEYIMGALPYINEALERNVSFKIIEPEDYAPNQDLRSNSPEELSILSRPWKRRPLNQSTSSSICLKRWLPLHSRLEMGGSTILVSLQLRGVQYCGAEICSFTTGSKRSLKLLSRPSHSSNQRPE
jgi:predicted transcriptional regulator